jgi:hypothetical protein
MFQVRRGINYQDATETMSAATMNDELKTAFPSSLVVVALIVSSPFLATAWPQVLPSRR